MQLVVVMAVRKAVSAATITFTAISMTLFFIWRSNNYPLSIIHCPLPIDRRLIGIESFVVTTAARDRA